MEVEICCFSVEDCLNAERAGANRVELCASPFEGGTTPSHGMIMECRKVLKNADLYVMIRPRGGDFLYSDSEFEVMKDDLLFAKSCGVNGVVFGLLNKDGSVDVPKTSILVNLALPLGVTFHRAFDRCANWSSALEDVISCGCTRILTSGLKRTVSEGKDVIAQIVKASHGRIDIMSGSGLNSDNALDLVNVGVNAVHLTAKAQRDSYMAYRNPEFIDEFAENTVQFASFDKIKSVVDVVNQCETHEKDHTF